jgi:hypothetical protein
LNFFFFVEAEYSVERNKAYVPMLMQTCYKPDGWLGLIIGSKLYIDFSKLPFDEALHLLLREIEAVRISLGVDGFDQTSGKDYFLLFNFEFFLYPFSVSTSTYSITTMDSSFTYHRNVNDWNADDVIDWLHHEKLEM